MKNILIGSHVPMTKPDYLLGSAQIALSYGANTFMIYTGAPQNSLRTSLDNLKIKEFHQYLNDKNIDINKVVVHAPYILNVASNDKRKWNISVQTLKTEVYRTQMIGCKLLVLHPGNAIGINKEQAIQNIALAINEINKTNKNVIICFETMAGKGSEVGGNFIEIKQIIDLVTNKNLIGFCLDTCHINDAGYDVSKIGNILKEIDDIIGLQYLKVIHLNDSKNNQNSHKDRHENIGYGTIGFETLLKYVYDDRLINIPKILETPYFNNKPMYREEIEIIKSRKWKNYR